MMWFRLWRWYASILVGVLASGCNFPDRADERPTRTPTTAKESKPGDEQPVERQVSFLPGTFPIHEGNVKAINKETMTIHLKRPGKMETYPFHVALADGGVQKNACGKDGYRVEDVRVGDHVEVGVWKEGNIHYVVQICILKRPGGRVPESPRERQAPATYARMQNAKNDFEDRGIPVPTSLKPMGIPQPPTEPKK